MRVLHVYKTSFPTSVGGIEAFIDTLSNHTSDLGVENIVLSLADVNETTRVRVNSYDVVLAKQNLFVASTGISWSAFKLFRELTQDADIIHFYFPNPFADLLLLFSGTKKLCLVTYQSDIIKQKRLLTLYRPLMGYFLTRMKKIVATSSKYLNSSKVLQSYKDKTEVIPIGISEPELTDKVRERIDYWKSQLPDKFFLFVGVLRYYKGLSSAIEAASLAKLPLIIAGKGPEEESLKQQAAEQFADKVEFLGFISDDDKWALLHLCTGFIMPSQLRSEAFGISLLEAAAMGKPMISCEIGTGTSYINLDGETGIVVEPNSPQQLSEAMTNIYNDDNLAKQYGTAAISRYKSVFTADEQAKRYLSVYQDMLN